MACASISYSALAYNGQVGVISIL
uniref:Uncharacterized protein n=1 Tax=Heterorhabditis bacteriophora TaxID=37862 RepID=A0A1I7X1I2_HETBA